MKVAFQGEVGSYSYIASNNLFPKAKNIVGFSDFSDVVQALIKDGFNYAVLPVFNFTAGRVSDIFFELYNNDVFIVGEYFLKINHSLIACCGVKISEIKYVYSHPQALAQSSKFIKKKGFKKIAFYDTAGSVKYVLENNLRDSAAVSSELSAQIYGGQILKKNISDKKENKTRFIILSKKIQIPKETKNVITSIFFTTKNQPASLYKALGAFATRHINLRAIESFMPTLSQKDALFYLEIEGTPKEKILKDAFCELQFFSKNFKLAGVFLSQ